MDQAAERGSTELLLADLAAISANAAELGVMFDHASSAVVPGEMADVLGITPLRFRNWLRAERAAGHALLAGHAHGSRWQFSREDADRLIGEYRSAHGVQTARGASQRSRSDVQTHAEAVIRERLAAILGIELRPRKLTLADGVLVTVDAAAADDSVIAEIFARQGRLKPGQMKKVAMDALKLMTIRQELRRTHLVLAFADPEAAACVQRRGWLSHALRAWSIQVLTVDISDALRTEIRSAQGRQRMVNATDVVDDVV